MRHPEQTVTGPFVRSGEQLTVTIGRNVGADPLSDDGWSRFQREVTDRVSALIKPSATFGPFLGTGSWTDDDGETVTEESAVFTFLVDYTVRAAHVDDVLVGLAELYGQDAIAWSHGPNHLARRP